MEGRELPTADAISTCRDTHNHASGRDWLGGIAVPRVASIEGIASHLVRGLAASEASGILPAARAVAAAVLTSTEDELDPSATVEVQCLWSWKDHSAIEEVCGPDAGELESAYRSKRSSVFNRLRFGIPHPERLADRVAAYRVAVAGRLDVEAWAAAEFAAAVLGRGAPPRARAAVQRAVTAELVVAGYRTRAVLVELWSRLRG